MSSNPRVRTISEITAAWLVAVLGLALTPTLLGDPPGRAFVAPSAAPVVIPQIAVAPIVAPPPRTDGLDAVGPCDTLPPAPSVRPAQYFASTALGYVDRRLAGWQSTSAPALGRWLGERVERAQGMRVRAQPPSADARLATWVALARGAGRARQFDTMHELGARAIAIAPTDPIGYVLVSEAASGRRDHALERAAIARAFELAPHEGPIAHEMLSSFVHSSDVMRTLAAADALLDLDGSPWRARSRAHYAARARGLAGSVRLVRGAVTIVVDPLYRAEGDHLLDLVAEEVTRVEAVLQTPSSAEVTVFVYPDRDAWDRGTCVGPRRRDASLSVVRGEVDEAALRSAVITLAVRDRTFLVPSSIRDGLAQYVRGVAPSDTGVATLVARGGILSEGDFVRALAEGAPPDDAAAAHAQARAAIDWLVARRGRDGLRALCDAGRAAWMPDPLVELGRLGGAPLDGPALLAFASTR